MNNDHLICDPERIELFLQQKLTDAEQAAFELHLDDCQECRLRLDATAARDEIWSGVRDSLSSERNALDWLATSDFDFDSGTGGDAPFSHAAVLKLLAPTDDDRMVGRLGTYEVVGVIGSGGMGAVLKAFDAPLNRYVAIKVLAPHLGSSGAARKRFSREAQAAAAVVHDNVIEIYGVSDTDGLPYLVMPYVKGPSLQRRLNDHGPLALVEILRIGMQAAAGLAAAHAQGLVHRDVKPANILLADGVERVKLTDFGLARAADDASLTKTGIIAGTPQYMSPEQARGDAVDRRSDLFSLGSVLYAMCTGRAPFRAETSYGVLRRITDEEPRSIREINPDIPEWLCAIIARLMQKRPEDRFESAGDVALLLEECLAHVQQPTALPLPESLRAVASSKRISNNRSSMWKWTAAAAFAIALLYAGVVVTLEWNKGTLTIESDADDVAVRITQGEQVVEKLTVSRAGQTVRVAAGTYVVEVEGESDGINVENGSVTLKRRGSEVVRIVHRPSHTSPEPTLDTPETIAKQVAQRIEQLKDKYPHLAKFSADAHLQKRDEIVLDGNLMFAPGTPENPELYSINYSNGVSNPESAKGGFSKGARRSTKSLFDPQTGIQLWIHFFRGNARGNDSRPAYRINDFNIHAYVEGPSTGPIADEIHRTLIDLGARKADLRTGLPVQERTQTKTWDPNVLGPPTTEGPPAATSGQPTSQPTAPQWTTPTSTTASGALKRLRYISTKCKGNGIIVACSADGSRVAVADGNPTRILHGNGRSTVKDGWKPSVYVLDLVKGNPDDPASLALTTAEEDALLAANERISHVEATALAFSPDGKMLAVGTSIGQVKLFNAQTGELVRSFDDEAAKRADKATPDNWKSFPRAMGSISSLAFSPDGNLLATCGSSFDDFAKHLDTVERGGLSTTGPGRLKLWNAQTGALEYDLVGHSDEANAVAFSPDGNMLASAGRWMKDGEFGNGVILWRPQTGEQIRSFKTSANGGTRDVAFSHYGKLLVMGTQRFDNSQDSSTGGVSVLHVSSGIEEWLVTVPGWAKPVAFTPDGMRIVAMCGGKSIRFLNKLTGRLEHEIRPTDYPSPQNGRWHDFAIASRGQLLAIAGIDDQKQGFVEVWTLPGVGDAEIQSDLDKQQTDLAKQADDNFRRARKAVDERFDADTPSQSPTATAPTKTVKRMTTALMAKTIACSADGKRVAISSNWVTLKENETPKVEVVDAGKPILQILDADTGKIVASPKLMTDDEDAVLATSPRSSRSEPPALAFAPDGHVLAVGTRFGQVKLFDARTGELLQVLDDEAARLADKKSPENWMTLKRAIGNVASLAFSPDGSLLAVCGNSFEDFSANLGHNLELKRRVSGPGRLKVFDVKTGTLKHDLAGHSEANAIAFSPGGTLACAGHWEGGMRDLGTGVILWNPQTGEKLRTIEAESNAGTHAVAFSPDGRFIAFSSVSFDKGRDKDAATSGISLAHPASGVVEWKRTLPGFVKRLAFFDDGPSVAALCGGRSIEFLDQATGSTLKSLDPKQIGTSQSGNWSDFAVSPHGGVMAIAGSGDKLGFVELRNRLDGYVTGDNVLPAPVAPSAAALKFSETKELVLSMDSMKFMLDLDTGETMDPPMANRPEQKKMDVHPTQQQPYEVPSGLSGDSFFLTETAPEGLKVKQSEWETTAEEVHRRLVNENIQPLNQMPFETERLATYFFRSHDGKEGVLQMLAREEKPKGIRLRYKTVERSPQEQPHWRTN